MTANLTALELRDAMASNKVLAIDDFRVELNLLEFRPGSLSEMSRSRGAPKVDMIKVASLMLREGISKSEALKRV